MRQIRRFKKVVGLIMLSIGLGMMFGLFLSGMGFLIALGLIVAGSCIWFL